VTYPKENDIVEETLETEYEQRMKIVKKGKKNVDHTQLSLLCLSLFPLLFVQK
jgi:hypothetical protein